MNDKTWWKNGVIYHIYPRSFLDTNGDGIGDLQGIIRGLPYVRDLGANAIWMGPVFSSPQVDNGYDISDYRRIDPLFGTSEDMDTLIDTAHGLGIRVLLDLVFNHTSDRHQWFQASRARDPEYDDFYIWRDAAADGGRPNNWGSFFTVPAWTWDEKRQQYYLHLFTPEQPDLNWENPRVRAGLADTANFWLDRGVDGFRMDVINLISKKPGLPSIPPGTSPTGYFIDGPNVLDYLREFRALLHRSEEIVLVGETPGITAEPARRYTDPENHALDMVLLFEHLEIDHGPGGKWDHRPVEIQKIRSVLSSWQGTLSAPYWSSLYMSNHDQPRIVSRYGNDARYRFESATALAAVFFLQRGTPIVYQGDELAMRNFPITSTEHLVDIESRNAYAHMIDEGITPEEALRLVKDVTRDNGRTPMQWSTDRHAGFTTADEPWYPVNPDFPDCKCRVNPESVPLPYWGSTAACLPSAGTTAPYGRVVSQSSR